MSPPPNAPLLSDFPGYIAEGFEKAFGPDGVQERPKPEKWLELLDRLEEETQKCSTNPAHHHVQGKSCPWCKMEHACPGFVAFTSTSPGVQILPIIIDTSPFMAVIASIRDPGVVPDIQSVLTVSANGSSAQAQLPNVTHLKTQHAVALGVSLLGFLLWQWEAAGLLAILFSCAGAALSLYPNKRVSALAEARRQAEQAWETVRQAWSRQPGNTNYLQVKSEDLSLVRDLNALPNEEKTELQQLENEKRKVQLERYLERHLIKGATIRKIGSARKAVLASFGIETAADVERNRVTGIQGFGWSLVSELLAWRRDIEQRFAFNAKEPISPAQIAAVKTGISNKKVALETKLRSTVTRLQQVTGLAIDQRSSLTASANAAFTRLQQTLSDERATHPIFTRVAKIISVSCLGIILLNLASTQQPSAKPPTVQVPLTGQQASTNSAPIQAPAARPPDLPAQEPQANDATEQWKPLAAGSDKGFKDAPTAPQFPPTSRNLASQPLPEASESAAPLPPPIEITGSNKDLPRAPAETAEPKLNPRVHIDAVQIQQRLFNLGFLATPPDGKWGQRSSRALQEFRAAHNLKNDAAWDRQTEDALLPSPVAPSAEATPLFAGVWRSEDESCGDDAQRPALRVTTARAEATNGRCDFE